VATEQAGIPFGRPWITDADREAVLQVLGGPILTHGPQVQGFESEFLARIGGGGHAVAVSSCMAALHLACLHLGIKAGDEVVVPAQTHVATAHAVELVGARPVFADCDPSTGNVTPESIERVLTPRTRAILVVHFVGIPCEMTEILDLAGRHDLKVIEDCALALGARHRGRHVGLLGDAGCFSFYPVKHITTGEGGMLVTRHAELARAVSLARGFGVDRSLGKKELPGTYDVPGLGLNYRMGEIPAALGRTQLRRLDENLSRRRINFEQLKSGIADLPGLRVLDAQDAEAESSHYCLSVLLRDGLQGRRDALVARLNAAGVGTSVYYPHPVPRLAYYRGKYGDQAAHYPQAAMLSDQSLALPVGPHLSAPDVGRIVDALREGIRGLGA
jgi:dTDP-4-amino-4,6-dideoxygalactose transaminase